MFGLLFDWWMIGFAGWYALPFPSSLPRRTWYNSYTIRDNSNPIGIGNKIIRLPHTQWTWLEFRSVSWLSGEWRKKTANNPCTSPTVNEVGAGRISLLFCFCFSFLYGDSEQTGVGWCDWLILWVRVSVNWLKSTYDAEYNRWGRFLHAEADDKKKCIDNNLLDLCIEWRKHVNIIRMIPFPTSVFTSAQVK